MADRAQGKNTGTLSSYNAGLLTVRPDIMPQSVKFVKNVVYGGIAGFIGSMLTFPVDLSKTRLQEQTSGQYKGIIPEKALKLSVNDFFRYQFRKEDGGIEFAAEASAGALAGLIQVIVTSPMEMTKIRMQLQSKKPVADQQSLSVVVRQLFSGGPRLIYRGSMATICRDVPYTAIFFPLVSKAKLYMAGQPISHPLWGAFRKPNTDHKRDAAERVNLLGTFCAGFLIGSCTAVAVTPMDVVKTRLQKDGGIELYKNIRTCVKMTCAEGGVGAFFKGATGRFLLIGPLFGVVLFTYEVMPKLIPL